MSVVDVVGCMHRECRSVKQVTQVEHVKQIKQTTKRNSAVETVRRGQEPTPVRSELLRRADPHLTPVGRNAEPEPDCKPIGPLR